MESLSCNSSKTLANKINTVLRDVPDFPKSGIVFKDITPVLSNPELFEECILALKEKLESYQVTHILGIEARGFLFGATLAKEMKLPFVPARKPGKLPWKKKRVEYKLEYGVGQLEIHLDAFEPILKAKKPQVAVVDDLLATGGTVEATCKLIRELNADPVVLAFLIELEFLQGREALKKYSPVESLCKIK